MVRVVQAGDELRATRPILRSVAATILVFVAAGMAYTALSAKVSTDDRFRPDDWWWVVAFFLLVATVYCYVASSLEVHSDVVVIKNPLRRLVIPLGHVTAASEGSNLRFETAYLHAYAWGVEAGNLDVGIGRLGKQVSLAHIVLARAADRRALDAAAPAARYRWVLPPRLALALLPLNLLTALAVLNDWHPLSW